MPSPKRPWFTDPWAQVGWTAAGICWLEPDTAWFAGVLLATAFLAINVHAWVHSANAEWRRMIEDKP